LRPVRPEHSRGGGSVLAVKAGELVGKLPEEPDLCSDCGSLLLSWYRSGRTSRAWRRARGPIDCPWRSECSSLVRSRPSNETGYPTHAWVAGSRIGRFYRPLCVRLSMGSLEASQGVYWDCMAKAKRPATSELRSWPSAFRTGGNGARGSLPGNGVPRGHGFCLRQRCDGATPATDDNRRGNDVEGTSGALSPTAGRVARRRWSNRPSRSRGRRSGLVRWTRLRRPSRWEGRDEKGSSASVRT